jgi:hypothetical protein
MAVTGTGAIEEPVYVLLPQTTDNSMAYVILLAWLCSVSGRRKGMRLTGSEN